MQRTSRLKRELQMLSTEPPPGITCWQTEERMDELRAQIVGGTGTPYEGGLFSLEIKVPERYPFEPPKMRFLTPIYHPNIDNSGRICHDALKLPPKGAWKPSLNISTVLSSIQLLMAEPNPDDPLMADISSEFKYNKQLFMEKARKWTREHAVQKNMDAVEGSKENNPDQKASSHKRHSLSAQQEGEEPAKKTCM
ncbi:ubiquitin-conjugating enzyme E2 T [Scophthalmus maximus]|nr:ubiquitin-conjugating enzyme E2 T [Scophthalmus maximus]XP_035500718.1 ubiquitin-conjugating enzyme E2 T [Scophthalmus maximus]XP_035500719.1 ubiquitin-conjugating enzyme E2 T [Scophthalmus maximus]XP_035500720.1 ubiquitin-conjugating enzyme E2 T [Scophthalmus maximus]